MTDLDADLERAVRAAAAVVFATGTEVEVLTRYEQRLSEANQLIHSGAGFRPQPP